MSIKPLSILLVEDDLVDVMNVKRAFKKNNISNKLHVAGNGLEALQLLESLSHDEIPKIILLDLNMPKMGGIDFLKALRNHDNHSLRRLSVFIMTTSNHDSDKINAYDLNVAGYILKPLSIQSFISSVSVLQNYWTLCEYPD
ncbi:MAG: response regulator [Bacteroidetes bacterium]|nr:response regulator [Bacteroidota bacterium]